MFILYAVAGHLLFFASLEVSRFPSHNTKTQAMYFAVLRRLIIAIAKTEEGKLNTADSW